MSLNTDVKINSDVDDSESSSVKFLNVKLIIHIEFVRKKC